MKEQSMYEETTIAAIATAPGEGGVGIIRLSGVSASEIADNIREQLKPLKKLCLA